MWALIIWIMKQTKRHRKYNKWIIKHFISALKQEGFERHKAYCHQSASLTLGTTSLPYKSVGLPPWKRKHLKVHIVTAFVTFQLAQTEHINKNSIILWCALLCCAAVFVAVPWCIYHRWLGIKNQSSIILIDVLTVENVALCCVVLYCMHLDHHSNNSEFILTTNLYYSGLDKEDILMCLLCCTPLCCILYAL